MIYLIMPKYVSGHLKGHGDDFFKNYFPILKLTMLQKGNQTLSVICPVISKVQSLQFFVM